MAGSPTDRLEARQAYSRRPSIDLRANYLQLELLFTPNAVVAVVLRFVPLSCHTLTSSPLIELLAQALHDGGLRSDPEESAFIICALLQYLASLIDFTAQLLCRPGKEKFVLDEILLEKRNYHLV